MVDETSVPGFSCLGDAEKAAIAADLAWHTVTLHALVRLRMIRQPATDEERAIAQRLAEMYPGEYALARLAPIGRYVRLNAAPLVPLPA